jgi:hypothetical protein
MDFCESENKHCPYLKALSGTVPVQAKKNVKFESLDLANPSAAHP